ncbi:Arf GTPase activating protein, partial [Colletotrichum caudatum]
DASWASINLGILLCIDSSGVHRSLGLQLSKVRSVELGSWSLDAAQIMAALGNTKVNGIFEVT